MASKAVQRIDSESFLASVRTGKSIVRYKQAQRQCQTKLS
jgi:hypothetical protein